jgi:hypothetical protein
MRGCNCLSDPSHPDGSAVTANRAPEPRPPAPVVHRVQEAADLIRQGTHVVLVTDRDDGTSVYPTGGPGRLALMVGPIDDPAVMAAAREMAAELF